MFLPDLLMALRARWREELAAFCVVLAVIGAWTLQTPRSYVATTTLLVSRDPTVIGEGPRDPVDMGQVLSTEAQILKSEQVLRAAIAEARLSELPEFSGGAGGGARSEALTARAVREGLSVDADRSSQVLTLAFASRDPEVAARTANAIARAYVEMQIRLQVDPAKSTSRWFEEETREERLNMERAQAALAEFQRANGFTDAGAMDGETSRLRELSAQLAQAEANSADVGSRAGVEAASAAEVQSTPVIQQLRTAIAEQSRKIADLSTHYGPRHPDLVAAQSEMDTLRTRLAEETRQAQRSLAVSKKGAERRVAELERLTEVQRQKMIGMADARNQLQMLQRDAESARRAYDQVTERLRNAELQAQLPRTSVRQLDPARPPLKASRPNRGLRAFLGLVLGALAAAGWGVFREWRSPRVRTAAGVQAAGADGPVFELPLAGSEITALLRDAS
ncbi:hypothetical protein LJR219_002682 [Phenylobacterium sp. LjRoot219]|uniref:GNVR domain-containing protein n=1 Tax=Phenylobacterium sp. LjRoot219 TaxID=3342283 RepID=UPI003ECF2BFB